jgi:myo-inositol-1(or 4)-monophosphatase
VDRRPQHPERRHVRTHPGGRNLLTISAATLDGWLDTARDAAGAAAAVHRRWAGRIGPGGARRKGGPGDLADFVSHVDEEAQEVALAVISGRHPEHAVLAEEGDGGDTLPGGGGPCWIVDPLDGTTNFLHGFPAYAASVGLAVEGRAVVGAVASAPTSEMWWARTGGGAWKNGRRVGVSSIVALRDALIGTGFPFKRPEQAAVYTAELARVLGATSGVRRAGAAALDLCWLAEGHFDAFWEPFLNPWDFAAGVVIVAEAGGCLDRIAAAEGGVGAREPELPLAPGSVLAANSRALLEALRSLL